MSRLDDAALSVPAGSAPADDHDLDPHDDDLAGNDPEPTGEQGDGDDSDEGGKDKEGRSLENVRGELLRKMQKQNEEMMAEIRRLQEASQYRPEPKPETKDKPKTLDDMSVAELEQYRDQVPEENKAQFERYITERRAAEIARNTILEERQKDTFTNAESKANEKAFGRWPQLHDKSSEFYRVTDRILKEMGPGADTNPRAVLDAANEAGLELGLTPQSFRPRVRRREPGDVQTGRTSRPPKSGKDDVMDVNSEEHQAIQKRLAQAMPGKKFTKEQLKRIAKRGKLYQENRDLFTRG